MGDTNMLGEKPRLRWGIIGTGKISTRFVSDILLDAAQASVLHTVAAVGSSSIEKGQDFVTRHISSLKGRSAEVFDNYADVFRHAEVDAVYVGTPHALHCSNSLDAIEQGKHVLVEKPMAINAAEAEKMIQAARAKGVLLMEGAWTKFLPITKLLQQQLVEYHAIGDVYRIYADAGIDQKLEELPAESRLKDLSLGAGSLLDLGYYAVLWATLLKGTTADSCSQPGVVGSSVMQDGVDIATSAIITYASGSTACQAIVTSTTRTRTDTTFARAEGSKGVLTVQGAAISKPVRFTIKLHGQEQETTYEAPKLGLGFVHEANSFALSVAAGLLENETRPLSESLQMMRVLDCIRKQGGVVYPCDLQQGSEE